MKIKINGNKHEIKPADQLTVKEYIQLFDSLGPTWTHLDVLMCYIATVTVLRYNSVVAIDIDENSMKRLFAYIGEVKQLDKMPVSSFFYHKRSGKTLYRKSLNWRTLGARKILEDRKTDNSIEQCVYLLSIYLSDDYDSEKIEEIYKDLQGYNAIEVFSFIVFFFKKFQAGQISGTSFLRRLLKKVSTSILKR